MRSIRLLLPFLLLLPCGAALAHGDDDHDAIEVRILMGEMYFQVDGQAKGEPLRLQAGQDYQLIFDNVGAMIHEVQIGRDPVAENGRYSGYRKHLLANVSVEIAADTVIDGRKRAMKAVAFGLEELYADPGVKLALRFELPAEAKGRWEIGCFIPGHYEGGMKLDVIVE